MKKIIFLLLSLFTLSISAQTAQDKQVELKYPELIEGKQLSDSTLIIIRALDQSDDSFVNKYYERYIYLKRTAPSEHVNIILEYATALRKSSNGNKK